ncbi:hypothetical protein BDV95DRAFT_606585 [Massariosphaeria phaeospora]|uniref:Uncharacterized protein n=1 Tax=Massariosphaeria phaeospora TaxID=100035 RepID=A0A7C8M968_9PLEO|nr:hypothetical protein BDV95DRAFT_606585 [Massariosphaeria phaeospora]
MSKRNSDGDVLANRVSLMQAKNQKLLASIMGSNTAEHKNELPNEPEADELDEEAVYPEQVGVGGVVPKDIQDGSFTRRAPTSNDRLLETLIGKKAAKAHIAAKQAPRQTNNPQKYGTPTRPAIPEESEDEEEGRAAAFKSKKRKMTTPKPGSAPKDEDIPFRPSTNGPSNDPIADDSTPAPTVETKQEIENDEVTMLKLQRVESKPMSYLDEILAERSSKKKKKKRSKDKVET